MIHVFLLFWLRKLPEFYFLAQAFRAGLRKLGPKNKIPQVFLTKKLKKIGTNGKDLLTQQEEDSQAGYE